jgi:hypothetical protein
MNSGRFASTFWRLILVFVHSELRDVTPQESEGAASFDVISDEVLQESGGGISLTEAAEKLGISRQALHKNIKSGRALGLMKKRQDCGTPMPV